jgi:hypothetical protein
VFFAAIVVLCQSALTCMAQSGDNSVAEIRTLEARLLAAEKAKDVDAMMKCYLPGDKLLVLTWRRHASMLASMLTKKTL